MKKTLAIFLAVAVVIFFVGISTDYAKAKGIKGKAKQACTTIQDGILQYASGHNLQFMPLMKGYDPFGYNYQAHMFNGSYANAYLGRSPYGFPPYEGDDAAYLAANPGAETHWVWPYRNITVMMKWNDAWLSNKDCTSDGILDRYFGFPSYIGSGAWLTNHMQGTTTIIDKKGREKEVTWTYFVKIVAAPADATKDPITKIWIAADGTEIGPDIWGAFAIIQEVGSDLSDGGVLLHGAQYISPMGPGFGKF